MWRPEQMADLDPQPPGYDVNVKSSLNITATPHAFTFVLASIQICLKGAGTFVLSLLVTGRVKSTAVLMQTSHSLDAFGLASKSC